MLIPKFATRNSAFVILLFLVICAYENFAQSECDIIEPHPWPAYQGNWPIEGEGYYSFPSQYYAIGDINYDGRLEVVTFINRYLGYGDVRDINNYVPYIEIYDAFGELIHRFTPEGSMPTLVDIDGDGTLEIFTQTCGIHVYHWDGTPVSGGLYKWPHTYPEIKGAIGTPFAIDDIDGDGILEVVGATNYYCGPGTNHTEVGKIYVWDIYGNLKPGWPVQVPLVEDPFNPGNFGQPGIWHTPTIGDLNGDGFKEIVIGIRQIKNIDGYNFVVYRYDGSILWTQKSAGKPTSSAFFGQPAIADIDGDGKPEIVVPSYNGGLNIAFNGEDGSIVDGWPVPDSTARPPAVADLSPHGKVINFHGTYLVKGDGTLMPGWPVDLGEERDPCWLTCPGYGGRGSIIGDIDGDGEPDIFIPAGTMICFGLRVGKIYAADIGGNWLEGYPYMCPGYPPQPPGDHEIPENPIITDIDLDGDVEIGFVSSLRFYLFDLPAPFDPTTLHWPKHGQNNQRTAYYEPPENYIPRVDELRSLGVESLGVSEASGNDATEEELNSLTLNSLTLKLCSGQTPEIEVRGAYFESKPFVWFVPEQDKTAFFKGDLSKGLPAQNVWMEPAPLRRGNYLRVTPPELSGGKYELVVQNPTGIRNVWQTATSPPAPVIEILGPTGCVPARSTSRTDMDCDGCVDELIEFSYSFGAKCGENWYNQDADFDASGTVDGMDLSIFINDFGKGCF